MNIKRAKEEIKDTIDAYLLKDEWGEYVIPAVRQRPVLLMGPPGVGKTQIMEQIAREKEIGLVAYTITHHTRQSAVGLPLIEKREYGGREYPVTEYTMSEIVAAIYNKIEKTGLKEGILFIDEINCVSETLAPAMLQFLQCKTFGSHRIPEGWIITAAGNPPEYNKSVREFDVVTLDRIKKIVIEPDLPVWMEYARDQGIHPAVISYLEIRPGYFCQIETTAEGKRFATPRGWEDLSQLLQVYEQLGKRADREVAVQYLQHPKIAKDFANYLELYYKYQDEYRVEEILQGSWSEDLCIRMERAPFDERLSVTGLLLSRLTEGFKELYRENQVLNRLMGQLKKYKGLLEEAGEGETAAGGGAGAGGAAGEAARAGGAAGGAAGFRPSEVLRGLLEALEAERLDRKKKGLLDPGEERIRRRCEALMEDLVRQLREGSCSGVAEAWQKTREAFMERSDSYEALKEGLGARLEAAFGFLEASFGSGQELVIFVTGLNTSPVCLWFLNQYECERYYQYNKELLFDRQEEEIRRHI